MRIVIVRINIFVLLLTVIILSACEKLQPSSSKNKQLVLQGYLYKDEPVSGIKLTRFLAYGSEDTIFTNIPYADVIIEWNDQQFPLQSDSIGLYSYPFDDLIITEGNSYRITAEYEGSILTAETTVPEKPSELSLSDDTICYDTSLTMWDMREQEFNSIEITWKNPYNDYFYVIVENMEENPESIELGFTPPGGALNFRFLSQPFITDTYVLSMFGSIQQYGTHRIKVFRVNEEYANLYENREQDSRNLTEPSSNVQNGLGIFTAFSYTETTFEVIKK